MLLSVKAVITCSPVACHGDMSDGMSCTCCRVLQKLCDWWSVRSRADRRTEFCHLFWTKCIVGCQMSRLMPRIVGSRPYVLHEARVALARMRA
jgi:hypothetical protein